MIDKLLDIGMIVLTVTVLLTAALQVGLVISATIDLRRSRVRSRHRLWRRMLSSPLTPKVSVLVPAYNEEVTIKESLTQILALTYPNLEIVVVDDGSSDRTEAVLIEHFDLVPVHNVFQRQVESAEIVAQYRSRLDPRLVVGRKVNGHGKADAINACLNLSSGDLVCAIDADTLVDPDALQKLVIEFIDDPDVVAAGGSVRLTNGGFEETVDGRMPKFPKQIWAACQAVEYARAFIVGRLGWNLLGGNLIVSGAFGVFRRDKVVEVGGYDPAAIGEDLDLIVRLRKHGYENKLPARVAFNAEPVAWTEAPEQLASLGSQRNRWYRGLLQVLLAQKRMILNPKYGTAGMIALPFFVIVEALAPIVEAIGLVIIVVGLLTGTVTGQQLLFVASIYGVGLLVSMLVQIFDDLAFGKFTDWRTRLRIVLVATFEQTLYRFMSIWWRLKGLVHYFQGRNDWGVMVRQGFGDAPSSG